MNKVKSFIEERAPLILYSKILSVYSRLHPRRMHSRLKLGETTLVIENVSGDTYRIPTQRIASQFLHEDYLDKIRSKYTLEGFVEVESGDVVFDVGPFIGGFAMGAAEDASRRVLFEPDRENLPCLVENLNMSNVNVLNRVAWHSIGLVNMNFGSNPTENSIFDVDGGSVRNIELVEADRIDNAATNLDLDCIDFLKIDAEGAEPEVIEGAKEITIRKIAVDCSDERGGESTKPQVKELLKEYGFEVRERKFRGITMVYGCLS